MLITRDALWKDAITVADGIEHGLYPVQLSACIFVEGCGYSG
jgi:hypothetical protein